MSGIFQGKSAIQAIVFEKRYWTTSKARKWLKKNNLQPIKQVHETGLSYRYRIRNPKIFSHFITKKIDVGLKLIIGFY